MTAPGQVWIVQIAHPGPTDDAFDAYWETGGRGARLSAMYGELLGMEPQFIGYHKLVRGDGGLPEIGFEYAPEDEAPSWGDPSRPTQAHVDVEVTDVDAALAVVTGHGGRQLEAFDDHVVCADPVGHPFCVFEGTAPGRIAHVVFDCFSPRSLATFYEALFGLVRIVDTPERVELAPGDGSAVGLAFQHSPAQTPRWPDPRFPAQLHLDVVLADDEALALAERLGAVRLHNPDRPDALVYGDPGGHPFCVGIGDAA